MSFITTATIHILYFLNNLLNFLCLSVKFTKCVRVYNVCFSHQINTGFFIFILKKDKSECKLALSSEDILWTELYLKEYQDVLQVFVGFLVVDSIDLRVVIIFNRSQVLFNNELSPDLDNFQVKVLSFLNLSLFFE